MKTRVLTVSCLMREGTRTYVPIPLIRLAGKWLEEAGFEPGQSVQVEVEHALLVISKLAPDGTPERPSHDPAEFPFVEEVDEQRRERKKKGKTS